MTDRKLKCQSCGQNFYYDSQTARRESARYSDGLSRVECPSCNYINMIPVSNLAVSGTAKRAVYDVGGALYFIINFGMFFTMTPQGILSAFLIAVSFFLIFSEGLLFLLLLAASIALAAVLFHQWNEHSADTDDLD